MARSDLLLSLVKAGATGDRSMLRSTVEALAADERAKHHTTLADRLTHALSAAGPMTMNHGTSVSQSGRDFLLEATPRLSLNDLVLANSNKKSIDELVEEQLRADLLRSHGVQPRHRILLAGPPGNGKTSVAEGIAEALSVPIFSVRYDQLCLRRACAYA